MTRKANETAAPSAKPRDRKNAMIAPAVSASCGGTFLGPKHMQRLARYPLEKENKIMKMMYQASWENSTGR